MLIRSQMYAPVGFPHVYVTGFPLTLVNLPNVWHGVQFGRYWLSIPAKFGRYVMISHIIHNLFVSLLKCCSYTNIIISPCLSTSVAGQIILRRLNTSPLSHQHMSPPSRDSIISTYSSPRTHVIQYHFIVNKLFFKEEEQNPSYYKMLILFMLSELFVILLKAP